MEDSFLPLIPSSSQLPGYKRTIFLSHTLLKPASGVWEAHFCLSYPPQTSFRGMEDSFLSLIPLPRQLQKAAKQTAQNSNKKWQQKMEARGLEPLTFRVWGERSSRLSYASMNSILARRWEKARDKWKMCTRKWKCAQENENVHKKKM